MNLYNHLSMILTFVYIVGLYVDGGGEWWYFQNHIIYVCLNNV